MPANLENSTVATGLEMVSFHSNPKERQCQRMLKLLHNFTHFTEQSDAQNSSSYMNQELTDVQAGFRKGKGSSDQIANIQWIIKNQEENSRNTSATAAKLLQSCPTLCDPIDGSPPGSPIPAIL